MEKTMREETISRIAYILERVSEKKRDEVMEKVRALAQKLYSEYGTYKKEEIEKMILAMAKLLKRKSEEEQDKVLEEVFTKVRTLARKKDASEEETNVRIFDMAKILKGELASGSEHDEILDEVIEKAKALAKKRQEESNSLHYRLLGNPDYDPNVRRFYWEF